MVLLSQRAPQNKPSCLSCCPLSKIEPTVHRVTAEVGWLEEMMRAVAISWRDVAVGLSDKEMVGEEEVSEISRWLEKG